ncbi:MAG: hypothetical protein QGI83_07480, partial [Candidatus Latescibacteria bacterium]|nr:hypothetical protein [Candidatus Latescibacterota bacterium]
MQIDSRAPEAPEAAFAADDVSVVLLYYLESEAERLGIGADDTGGSGQRRERLAGLVDPDDSRIRERLREIPAARGVDVAEILRQDAYRERLLDVALERLRVGPDAPALRIGPGRREPERDGIGFGL